MKKLYSAKFATGEILISATKKNLHRAIKKTRQCFSSRMRVVRFARGWTDQECIDKLEG